MTKILYKCDDHVALRVDFFENKRGDLQVSLNDLRSLSIQAYKLCDRERELHFERLGIIQSVVEEMFAYNRFKLVQIPPLLPLTSSDNKQTHLTVYRIDDYHADITCEPSILSIK